MRRLAGILLPLLIVGGCGKQPATDVVTSTQRVASETVVTVEAPPVEINAGASTETRVRLKVDHGYHINANPASFSYLIATELNVPKADGISAAKVSYPQPLIKKFSFSNSGGGYNQRDQLKLQVTVARLVKHDARSRRRIKATERSR